MTQTMISPSSIRPAPVRPETESALRDMAFVLTLAQRVRDEIQQEIARR